MNGANLCHTNIMASMENFVTELAIFSRERERERERGRKKSEFRTETVQADCERALCTVARARRISIIEGFLCASLRNIPCSSSKTENAMFFICK